MKKLYLFLLSMGWCLLTHSQVLSTICGNGISGYTGNGGPAINAQISHPNQLAFDVSGNLYIAEDYNHVIRKIDVNGIITTVAGTGVAGFSGDGGPATSAQLNRSCGVAVDAGGNIYIVDANNYRIRKVNTAGIISTIAGTGVSGYSGDGGSATAATISFSSGICLDSQTNIYFATQQNGYCIRKIDPAGTISTYAGTGVSGFSGDGGPAIAAQLNSPASVCFSAGNLYIGDLGGMRIRKVNAAGIISTFAGNGSAASGGDGSAATSAQLLYPYGTAVDGNDNMYICESGNNKIRKINSGGIISTFAGTGGLVGGYGGDGGPLLSAQFYHPSAIAIGPDGNIYIGDFENNAIRKITLATGIDPMDADLRLRTFPNPAHKVVEIQTLLPGNKSIEIINVKGQILKRLNFSSESIRLETETFLPGIYTLVMITQDKVLTAKIQIIH